MENFGITHIPIQKAMEVLSISKYTIYGLIDDGRLKKYKVGKKTFLKIDEINNLFNAS